MFHDQREQKIGPIFGNVAKTVAKISKLKLKVQNIYTQLLLMLKFVHQTMFSTAYLAENVKLCSSKK